MVLCEELNCTHQLGVLACCRRQDPTVIVQEVAYWNEASMADVFGLALKVGPHIVMHSAGEVGAQSFGLAASTLIWRK